MNLSDKKEIKKVIKECVNGKKSAQHKFYQHFYGKMMGVCYRYTNNPDDAKDLLHDGFLKVFDNLEKFNFKGSLEGWVRRIMVNCCIDHYRKRKNIFAKDEEILKNESVELSDEEESRLESINVSELLQYVQRLSPAYRTVFNMYVLDGMSHKEIAEELDISEGTSKSNLAKAKMNLRKLISKELELD